MIGHINNIVSYVLIAGALILFSKGVSAKVPTSGYYVNEDKSGVVQLAPCGRHVCGTLVWGKGMIVGDTDVANPNPAKKMRPICGLTILKFDRNGKNGWGYDPETGSVVVGFDVALGGTGLLLGGEDGERWDRVSAPRVSCQAKEVRARVPHFGYFFTHNGSAIVQLKACGRRICASLVWGRNLKAGAVDRQGRRVCGMVILKFNKNGRSAWAYDPESGKVQKGFRVLDKGEYMSLGGTYGEVWKRAEPPQRLCR